MDVIVFLNFVSNKSEVSPLFLRRIFAVLVAEGNNARSLAAAAGSFLGGVVALVALHTRSWCD